MMKSNNKQLIFLFSGQGSQYYHMGYELYKRQSVFRKWVETLDEHAADLIGESVISRVYNEKKGRSESFDRLLYSHPAIFIIEYSLAKTLIEAGIEPDGTLGASLGEFAAAAISGIVTPEEALEAVVIQAKLVESRCSAAGMLAILFDPALYGEHPLLRQGTELAAVNFDSHFVISGECQAIARIEDFLKKKGIVCQLLPVRYGFHSPLIDAAGAQFKDFLSTKQYCESVIPFFSCATGEINRIAKEHFWNATRKPMRFSDTIRELEKRAPNIYIDVGPGGTLANFTKRNLGQKSGSETYHLLSLFHNDLDNLKKLTARCSVGKT